MSGTIVVEWVGGPWDGKPIELPGNPSVIRGADSEPIDGDWRKGHQWYETPIRRTEHGYRAYWYERTPVDS